MGARVSKDMEFNRGRTLTIIPSMNMWVKRQEWDWNLAKGSAIFSFGQAIARLLSLVFLIVVARAFSPSEYGAIQYAIAVASVVAKISAHPTASNSIGPEPLPPLAHHPEPADTSPRVPA